MSGTTYPLGLTGPAGPTGPSSLNQTYPVGGVGPTGPTGPTISPTAPGDGTGSVTAKSAHSMLIAVSLELAFVVVATMIAGVSPAAGNGVLALMVALLILRGLFQVNVFGAFVQNNPLSPPSSQTSNAPSTTSFAVV